MEATPNRGSIDFLMAENIDPIGPLPDVVERSAAAMKSNGIDPAFGPAFFILDQVNNTLKCPAGKRLECVGPSKKRDHLYQRYQAQAGDCAACVLRPKCCPKATQGRLVSRLESEYPPVAELRQKMETEAARQIYRQRGPVAEFPNAWLKEKLGLRKFHVRGLAKAATEALWACLTYNVQLWIRLSWRKPLALTV